MNSINETATENFFKSCEKSSNSILMLLDAAYSELKDEPVSVTFSRGKSPDDAQFRLANCLVLNFYHQGYRLGWQCMIEDEDLTPDQMRKFAIQFKDEKIHEALAQRRTGELVAEIEPLDAANGDDPLEKP